MTLLVPGSAAPPLVADGREFSLVLGCPLYQLLRRVGLSDEVPGLVWRRILFVVSITWAPLLALSAVHGSFLGVGRTMPFVNDVECHVRFLVSVPLLIVAELFVYRRMRPLINQLRACGLVRPGDMVL